MSGNNHSSFPPSLFSGYSLLNFTCCAFDGLQLFEQRLM
ncbi:hypothetical protein N646_3430 [Vibrio alginolyticus NBRC 15630 = ATCC 17749]|uniref:Uncharacterized protein n=1 Tax=Vibrio alginolyticus (strain ATCC 17749 / DSM 2171 / NBRC 15630 / NCIMB 1903 / NCTC 12160 / XII-53) TaxID=1219076 RepID=A0A2I3CMV8_VIBAX|nr:hypothetical protein N646_3430 [Vibrio alginolyticus NBRC 15630 = ATCC 17749]